MSSRLLLKIFLFVLLIIPGFSGITLFAHQGTDIDTTAVEVRGPGPDFVESYRSRKEFKYVMAPAQTNTLKQLWAYLQKHFKSLTRITELMPWGLKVLMWLLVLFFLFVVITQTKLYKIFYSGEEEVQPLHTILSSDYNHAIDFDSEITKLVEQQQYRLAIRLLYLKGIQQLREKEFIQYSKDKTNVDYLRDLNHTNFKSMFYRVTHIYNYVWYGDTDIAEDQFLRFEKSFQSLYSAINVQK